MADRYWVGGTGTWDASTTTHWSATSGGAGGASAPTSIDDVFLDASSNPTSYTVTTSGIAASLCNNIVVIKPLTGTITLNGGGLTCYGSLTFPLTNFVGGDFSINFSATSLGNTINLGAAANSGSGSTINFNGSGSWTLLSNMAYGGDLINIGSFSHTGGTLYTNGYYLQFANWSTSGNNRRALYLGSSTIRVGTVNASAPTMVFSGTNLTFDCGTSTLNTYFLNANGMKFYNFGNNPGNLNGMKIGSDCSFNNISISGYSGVGIYSFGFIIGGNTTIRGIFNNDFSLGDDAKIILQPAAPYITLTLMNAPSISNMFFSNIIVNGPAAPISGVRLRNQKGNSGINFNPKTVYWNLAGAQNISAVGWALTSGGVPNANNTPMPQDTMVFDDAGSITGTININIDVGTIDMSGRTSPIQLTLGSTVNLYGNWINNNIVNISGGSLNIAGRGSQTIKSSGVPMPGFTVNSLGGTVTLLDAYYSYGSVTLNDGTLDINNYNLTASTFASSTSTIRSLRNCSNITLFGNAGTIWNTNPTTNMIFTGIPNINLVYAGSLGNRTIDGTFFPANFNIIAGNDSVATTSGYNFDFTGFSGLWNQGGSVIYGSIKCSNLMTSLVSGSMLTLQAYTSFASYVPTTCTLDTAGKKLDFPVTFSTQASYFLKSDLELGPTRTLTLNQGTLDLNGFNLSTGLFSSSVSSTRLLNIGNSSFILSGTNSTIWNTSTSTNLSIFANNPISCTGNISTGTRIINGPQPLTVPVDFNILAGTDTVTIAGAHSVNYTGWRGTMGPSAVYGDVVFGPGSLPTTNILNLNAASGVKTITSNGNIINFPLVINGAGSYVLQDALTLGNPSSAGGYLNFASGTFDANDYNVTTYWFNSLGTFYIRSGTLTITGTNGTVCNFSGTLPQHTGSILLSNSSSGPLTTRLFNGGGFTFNKLIIGGVGDNSVSTTQIGGNNTFLELNSIKTSEHTVNIINGTIQTIKKWSITGSPGKFVRFIPSGAGSSYTLNLLERVTNVDYLIVDGLIASRAEFYAGRNSIQINVALASGPLYFTEAPMVPKTYYCVADGIWNLTNPTIWSLTSGGQGGAGVPTSIDNVIFNSSRIITIVNAVSRCNDLTISSNAGTVNLGSAQESLFIFGSLDNQIITKLSPATGLRILCVPYFCSTKSGNKINFNGSGPNSLVLFDGMGGSWQLTSFLDVSSYGAGTLQLQNGTLDTAGNPLSMGSFNSNYTTNRTLLLRTSTMNLTSATPWTINPINFNYVASKII